MSTVADGLFQYGGVPVGMGVPPFFSMNSRAFFVDPVNGLEGNDGRSPQSAFQTLYRAHYAMTAGNNDICFLIGNGSSTGSARLSLALAVAAAAASNQSAPTTGVLNWSKNACHLIGVAAPGSIGQRARIAPPTGTYTAATFGSGNLVVVTGQGCYFSNVAAFHGFSTGGASQICWTDSGRNTYENCAIQGMGDAASADTTTGRSLLCTGSVGESTFRRCLIGLDTLARGNKATTEIEFAGGSPRNFFEGCTISTYAKNAGATWATIGGSGIDRYVLFRDCMFTNPVLPATAANATEMTVGMSINAAAGGVVLVQNSMFYGAATMSTSALCFSNLPAANAKGGLGVVAS